MHGGVGDRVKLIWEFSIYREHSLVPATFTCVKPFKFATGSSKDCSKGQTSVNLSKFTARTVKLPFFCLYTTTTPPPGTNYTKFGSVAYAKGALVLRRTRQH